ncbi:MAG: MotA/TolQ/ExbB proton channel family protein [Verrucomicrobiota bacterium]|jgi:biopolymer transport protein ExbB/TolQ|nr:MotA/TolQ/ExbB proton channel family protein [Verrucomicrobiota bacterium]MDG1889712.1 MotA/TolQ/ExbB proton channel family protein [Verrucomicrobiota bacterium]
MTFILSAVNQVEFLFVWSQARPEGKAIIIVLILFSIFAWSVMASKSIQIRRAKKLNLVFDQEFRQQEKLTDIFNRDIKVEGCPLYAVYVTGNQELLDCQRRHEEKGSTDGMISLKSMGHVKRGLERAVAQESLRLESGLILLAIAVSGAPFLGLLGTVWGVMSAFAQVASQQNAQLTTIAPGVAGALVTTVAGLLVAIPSMFGYNWLVHNIRVLSVEMDNFAQELASKVETDFVPDE